MNSLSLIRRRPLSLTEACTCLPSVVPAVEATFLQKLMQENVVNVVTSESHGICDGSNGDRPVSRGLWLALCDQKQGEVARACPHVKDQNKLATKRPPHAGRSSREWFKNTAPPRHLMLWSGIVSCNPP